MSISTHGLYVAGGASSPIATPTLIVGFDMARRSRSVSFSTDAGTRLSPRPASLRSGRMQFLFAGPNAATESSAVETSIASGIVHVIYADSGAYTWSVEGMHWALAEGGEVRRTLNEDRATWTVTIDAQEVDFS